MMDDPCTVVLQNDRTCLVLTSVEERLPTVLHWGNALGEVTAADVSAMYTSQAPSRRVNGLPDAGLRPSLLPEQWTGWTGHPGLSGSRAGRDWAPRFTVDELLFDGTRVSGFTFANTGAVTIRASDQQCGLSLELVVEFTVEGLVRQRATVDNTGDDGYQLDQLLLFLPVPQRATELLDLCGRWGKERVPQRSTLGVGSHWREGRHGRTGSDSAFVLHLGETGFGFSDGEVWGVHTAWSGNHVHCAEKVLTGDQLIGGGELLLPGEVVLAHGESYTSPWMVFSHGTGLDEPAAQHHDFLRRTHPVGSDRPVTLNVWEAVYFDHDEARLLDLARRAAALGVERFVLDDGWFSSRRSDTAGLGDWVVSPDMWPHGLHPLVDEVTRLGMQFGLWFEPEMVNPDSDVARAHPDWVQQVPGRMPLQSRRQWVMNLTVPGAYAHVRDQMLALLAEYPIRYIKWDHNRDLVDAGTAPDGRPVVHAQTQAFYRLVDALKAAHPGLEIESCSSGGSRVDLEVLQHCDRIWASDNIDPTDRQQILCWTAQLVPPEYVGSHIASGASHTTGRQHTLAHRAATAVFGHLGIEWDLAAASQQELHELGQWITWFKAHRSTLLGGRTVRVDLPFPGVYLHGVVTPELGIYGYTELELPPTWSNGMVPLPGLEWDARYRVRPLDLSVVGRAAPEPVILTGRQLAVVGVRAPDVLPEHTRILLAERLQ